MDVPEGKGAQLSPPGAVRQLALIYFLLVRQRERELLDMSFAVVTCMWVAGCGEGAHTEVPQLPRSQGGIGENR